MKIISKIEGMPIAAVATCVGLATLANVWNGQGFSGVRHVTMLVVVFVWLAAILKITRYSQAFRQEYSGALPASLYGTFTMLTMILGSYIASEFSFNIGRFIWLAGTFLHMLQIVVYTIRFIVVNRSWDNTMPSWFVTYIGLLVSVVVAVDKSLTGLLTGIVIYGFICYVLMIPFVLYRMKKYPLPAPIALTRTILLAPPSLLTVGYLSVVSEPIPWVVYLCYGLLWVFIIYFLTKLPTFLRNPFNPGFASLTFPTAIALVATMRVAAFMAATGHTRLATFFQQVFGIQLWITTTIIAYVAYNFIKLLVDSFKVAA